MIPTAGVETGETAQNNDDAGGNTKDRNTEDYRPHQSDILKHNEELESDTKKEKMKVSIFAPMGSQNDEKIEFFAKKNKLNFFKLSDRHFKH